MQNIELADFSSGVQKNKKPVFIANDAFANLYNAYVYRGEVRKREGLQFLGRYRRTLTAISEPNANGTSIYNISDLLSTFRTTESNSEIQDGSVVITIDSGPNQTVFTDQGNGTLLRTTGTAYQIIAGSFINYVTGELNLVFSGGGTPANGVSVSISFNYYPALPAMGIPTRDIAGINGEQAIFFDTKYAYIQNGFDFVEFLPAQNVTWTGTDYDFFWGANYRGSDSQTRLFFVTNFVTDQDIATSDPIRYTDGITWTDFIPTIGSTEQINVLTMILDSGSAAFAGTLANLPIVEGSVVITVEDNLDVQPDIVFRDTPMNGTLVSSGANTGTINYTTGAITLSFNPVLPSTTTYTVTATYNQSSSFLFQAKILIPYYGRLIALNTWEGTTLGQAVNIYNRARFSQIGSPIQQDAWKSDTFGKGGFIDAPTNEDIISAAFYKNTLIVFFESSTWRLQYLGEYGIPFIWERISSDFGSESTFSTILFDSGVLTVGDKAIVGSSGTDVKRIDLDIPDTVYDFKRVQEGPKRVQGIRDFRKELVFWCYPRFDDQYQGQYFPNYSLIYNYRNNTYAFFRNNITCFGNFKYPASITWDRLDVFWDNDNVLWDDGLQENYPTIVSGNQQGFAHFYGYPDAELQMDSTIDAQDQESLAITAISVASATGPITLMIPNHNLTNGEWIYLTGMQFLVESTSTPGTTTLNNEIYQVQYVDNNNIILALWDIPTQVLYTNFSGDITAGATYIGGGVIALFPKVYIQTKDFNPAKQVGMNVKTSYVDFLFDTTSSAIMNIIMRMNATDTDQGNLQIGNYNVETCNNKTGYITGIDLTNTNFAIITSINHGLLNGADILFSGIQGTTQLNGGEYIVTFISTNTFSIPVVTAGLSAYISMGYWTQVKEQYFTLGSQYTWHRFYSTSFGQYLSLIITNNNDQMSQLQTHQQAFVLNAMKIYYLPGGRNIFGV